ncbi:MAG: efflux RND transporter periplasmic adaptor subunit [Pseudomonadota bacterium]
MNRSLVVAVFLGVIVAACSSEPPPPPPAQVVVAAVEQQPFQPVSRYVGRLQARDDVAIQAKVTGYLQSRDFREGDRVQAGDVLYHIEDSEYLAALAGAKADLAAAQAARTNAQSNFRRGQELLPKGAISQAEMDDLTARKLDAEARVEAAEASIQSAQANLDFTTITAPITGRIGRSVASVGDLVGPNTGDLTTLVSMDPMEALFQVSESTYIAAVSNNMQEGLDSDRLKQIQVTLELTNGDIYPEVGQIDYFANRIDQTTGTFEGRAEIPNPNAMLVPGQYVRVILTDTETQQGLFIPQAAVQADQQGSFVLVVNDSSMVERRNVELGDRHDDKVLVDGGLKAGEEVIVRGLQQVRQGVPVQVQSAQAAAQEQAAATQQPAQG